MEIERKLNVLPVRTFLSRGVTGVKCAHAPHFQPNCHFPQNFAFRRNKVASDFRTQGWREGIRFGTGLTLARRFLFAKRTQTAIVGT